MQIQPLSTYSVFGAKNVSLKDGKSLKFSKFLVSINGSAFQRDRRLVEGSHREGIALESNLESLEHSGRLSYEPRLYPEL